MGKKLKIKIIALFLAAFLTFAALSGCDKKGDNLPSGGNNSEITDGGNGNQGNGNQDNQGGNADPGEEPQTFTVTFVSNGGTEISPQQIKQGEKAVKPIDPEKINYVFVGWFSGETEWNFETMRVGGNITLTAKWTAEFTPPYPPRS